MSEEKLLIQDEMAAIDLRDKGFYNRLTPGQKKLLSPWLLMRYASNSTKHPEHFLLMVNELVNKNFSDLRQHPQLQWMLLALCGTGVKEFHQYLAPAKRKSKGKVRDELKKIFPQYRDYELDLFLKLNTENDLREFFEGRGYQDKDIKEIFK